MSKLKITDSRDRLIIEVDNVGIPYATAYEITRNANGFVLLKLNLAMHNPEIEIESENLDVVG